METPGRVTPATAEGSGTMARSIDQAAAGTHEAIAKVTDAARPTVDRMASGAHQAVDKIAGVATQAAETLGVKGDQIKEAQARLMEECRGYVRNNPLASLGIAVAAGFLLSRLISSR